MESIFKLTNPDEKTIRQLLYIWETAVSATHTFLSEQDINELKPKVKQGIAQVNNLYFFKDNNDKIQGFIGISHDKVEMLFVDADARGKGIGKKLINYAIHSFGIRYVDVNEQNPQAIGFYEHMGFRVFERSEMDEQGNAFPILHMKL